jgi:tetratricopeptide (TPR) repeat protein
MKRRSRAPAAMAALLLVAVLAPVAHALDEAERLWLVGERAVEDRLYALAQRVLERFVDRFPGDRRAPQAWLLLARARLGAGDAERALLAVRRAQSFRPPPGRPLEARFWEAEALLRLRRFAEAREAYEDVLGADATSPFAPDALYGLAWSHQELGERERAAKAFGDLLETWPNHALAASATYYYAHLLTELGRVQDALPHLEAFVARQPEHPRYADARFLLGWTRLQLGQARAGVEELRAFLAAFPGHPQAATARRLITYALARHGDRREQQEAYRNLLAESPPTPEGLHEAAQVAGRLGRPRDQELAWRRLRREFPDHPLSLRAALELATAAYKRKDWREVTVHAQAAARSEDEAVRAEGWLLAGEAELKLRRFRAAREAFEAALEATADEALRFRALAGLGLAHEEQREWSEALQAYEAVAEHSSDTTLRDWARERAGAVKARLAPPPAPRKSRSAR